MDTNQLHSTLNTNGAAVLYWVCLMIGVLMWTLGELTTTSYMRQVSRDVAEVKTLVELLRTQQCQSGTTKENGNDGKRDTTPSI